MQSSSCAPFSQELNYVKKNRKTWSVPRIFGEISWAVGYGCTPAGTGVPKFSRPKPFHVPCRVAYSSYSLPVQKAPRTHALVRAASLFLFCRVNMTVAALSVKQFASFVLVARVPTTTTVLPRQISSRRGPKWVYTTGFLASAGTRPTIWILARLLARWAACSFSLGGARDGRVSIVLQLLRRFFSEKE